MVRPIVPVEPSSGGRDRASSNSGRPIQRGMSHRASVNSADILGAQASTALPVKLKPVNARERNSSIEGEPPKRPSITDAVSAVSSKHYFAGKAVYHAWHCVNILTALAILDTA